MQLSNDEHALKNASPAPCQVVLNQKDVTAAWRAKTLSFDGICEWGMIRIFGMTPEGAHKMHANPDGNGDMYINQHGFWRESLAPGDNLKSLMQNFFRYLEINMEDTLRALPKDKSWTEASLLPWVRDTIGISATNAIAGPNLLRVDPKIMERMTRWESNFFLLALGLPKWVFKKASSNLDKMTETWMKLGVDPELFPPLIKRTDMVIARGASDWDIAASNLSFWLG